jgi:hypothetical protein
VYSANATRFDPFGFDTRLYCRRKRQGHGLDRESVVFPYRSCDLYNSTTRQVMAGSEFSLSKYAQQQHP